MKEENVKTVEEFKEKLKTLKEFEVFFVIESTGGMKWREDHDYADGRFKISAENFQENQEFYAAILTESSKMLPSFGVDPESIKDRPNGDYWKWYHFWKTWMESFSNDGWREFESKYEKDENIEDLLPKTKWNDPVEGPAPAKKEEKKE